MGYRIFQPFVGARNDGEYVSYPKYRTHLSLDGGQNINKPQQRVLRNEPHYRVHHAKGAFMNTHSSSGYGRTMGTNYAVYRSHMSNFGEFNDSKKTDLLNFNEKQTMQSLNGRLASYLGNVKSLEEENVWLEKKICDWYENNQGFVFPDCSQYFNIIMDLQGQVFSVNAHNANLTQEIEDGQMTTEGYGKNYEMELVMRTKAEEELCHYYGLLENIQAESQALDLHTQYLEEEILHVKKTSQEEITCLQAQLGTRVDVEVEPAPSIDLNAALSEIRNEYETLMKRNLDDVENFFHEMISELSLEVSSGIEQIQVSSNEVTGLKLCVHTLETELRKQLSMITAHESTLAEIHEHYGSYLSHFQGLIHINESHVAEIQSTLKQLTYEYDIHMDLKTSLEKEIEAYKYLLDGHDTLAHTRYFRDVSSGLLSSRNPSWEMTEVTGQFCSEGDEDTSEQI
ncbi:hypothetical protein GDO81_013233 [Engystomops pustulosus]|uniref:IF rod domain-containing protein n=1 Tax=Engystomops pustulosus TaxID=76066 RepID=A0AAV7AZ35_ENGPU|nr:hypothetical protein GDO81_013233 [Engystomops pustulosus]